MANPTGGYGFAPVGNVQGGPYNGETIRVYSPSSLSVAIFVGDVVEYTGAGSSDGYAVVTPTAATDAPWGVITGIEAIPTNLEANNYKPASTAAYMRMVPVDGTLFKVRMNGSGTSNEALIGSTTIYVVAAGSTVTGYSGILLSATDAGTSVADEVRIVGMVDRADNDISIADPEALVMFNASQVALGAAGV
jgi:hypothetical protein